MSEVTIPEGWSKIKLEECVSNLISGQSPNRKDNPAIPGKYGILKTTAIDWGVFDETKNQEVLDDFVPNDKHLVKSKDVLITKAGPAHRVGVVAIVNEVKGKVLVSGKMTSIRVNDTLSADYLSYALCQKDAQNFLQANTTGMASSQTNFTHDALLRVPILKPPLPEQQKIASILTSVDDVIEKTQSQINKLQDLKKGTMNKLLTRGIGHTEFVDSPVGKIPRGWGVVKLSHLIDKVTGGVSVNSENRQRNSNEFGILKTSSISRGNFNPTEHKAILAEEEKRANTNPKKDTILFSRMNTPQLVGESGYVGIDYPSLFLPDRLWMLEVKDKERTSVKWLSYILISQSIRKKITDVATGTSGSMKNISKPNLLAIQIPLPPTVEQHKIASILSSIDKTIEEKQYKLEQTKSLKKSLMQNLLTGKVRVKVN